MKRIAIIGGGIVGSTATYYLSKNPNYQVTLFDDGVGQATKAAAGIICPWFSKRRNKPWYRLSNAGAHFYPSLLADMTADGLETCAYQQKTTWIVKKRAKQADDLIEIAKKRQLDAPLIQRIQKLNAKEVTTRLPYAQTSATIIETDAGAIIDGEQLCKDLQLLAQKNGATIVASKVSLTNITSQTISIDQQMFDGAILASGAWLKELLEPLDYNVDVRPQKGQLAVYQTSLTTSELPLIMLDGEGDIIPHKNGQLFVGATHEDDKGFDLSVTSETLAPLFAEMKSFLPDLKPDQFTEIKVGTRAYTSDYAPFFGFLPGFRHITLASGLGSSGLTSGPLIGKQLAQLLMGDEIPFDLVDYNVANYISK